MHARFFNTKQAFRAFGESVTAYSVSTNTSFPYVTIDMFEVDAANARERSGVESLGLAPYLTEDQLEEWGHYTFLRGAAWLQQSRVSIEKPKNSDEYFYVSQYDAFKEHSTWREFFVDPIHVPRQQLFAILLSTQRGRATRAGFSWSPALRTDMAS